MTAAPVDRSISDIDLGSLSFWARPHEDRLAAFERLRQIEKPMYFGEPRVPGLRSGKGFYALVRHKEVTDALRNPQVFSSYPSVSIPPPPRWAKYIFGNSMVNLDDPQHGRLRRIIARAFTPRMLNKSEEDVTANVNRIIDRVIERGPGGDFITMVANPVAAGVICDMVGVPEEHRKLVIDRVHTWADYTGVRPGFLSSLRLAAKNTRGMLGLRSMVIELGKERRKSPKEDVISSLVTANIDGEKLTSMELGAFFTLLVTAGINTASNGMAHGLRLLTEHPEQRELLLSDFDRHMPTTIEEIIRYVTPGMRTGRTITTEHEVNGQRFLPGDKVVLYFLSANRDETVFTDPDAFDITRDPNPHVGFGAPGIHFCLGANLVRKEMTVAFRELFRRLPEIRAVGKPRQLRSNFENGLTELRFEF
ncbi:cytochrome P450 [Planotetraspora sp. A-T 1434]|uniref:cytochrome P450 n=1 Tax=Planotetraspora sp. A-T 1434 TaxID=2979219 RepID=UPI0021BF9B1B|nr:cytochrome P450 [Planotetraspora sp. A-T 1434]MCT9932709.1 cytochrome P450 [Planotetraspora sp. A-T 1434]